MYRVLKDEKTFEYYPVYRIAWFPDGLSEEEVKSIEERREYSLVGLLEVKNDELIFSVQTNPWSVLGNRTGEITFKSLEELVRVVRQYVDENQIEPETETRKPKPHITVSTD